MPSTPATTRTSSGKPPSKTRSGCGDERAAREGWAIHDRYSDHSISGASLIRPGIQALLRDAQGRRFQVVLTESLDRVSRDQEDIAGVYKRLRFAGVRIVTLSEGEISELHIGLKGTMGAVCAAASKPGAQAGQLLRL